MITLVGRRSRIGASNHRRVDIEGPGSVSRADRSRVAAALGVHPPPATLWRRALARVIDGVTVFFVLWMLVVLQVFWFVRELSLRIDPEPWGRAFAPLIIYLVLAGVYEVVYLRWSAGQTPGKQLMRIRVVGASDAGGLSLVRAFLRWMLPGAGLLVWPLTAGVAMVGLTAVSVPLTRRRRTLHDFVAGTVVVAASDPDEQFDDGDDID